MRNPLANYCWNWQVDTSPNDAAQELQDVLVAIMNAHVPAVHIHVRSGAHPWFNEICLDAVRHKQGPSKQAQDALSQVAS